MPSRMSPTLALTTKKSTKKFVEDESFGKNVSTERPFEKMTAELVPYKRVSSSPIKASSISSFSLLKYKLI